MYSDLQNKVAIVTGGSSGIGRGIAERFADEGVNVVITGRHEDFLKKVADDHAGINYVVADITKEEDTAKADTPKDNYFYHNEWLDDEDDEDMVIIDLDKL